RAHMLGEQGGRSYGGGHAPRVSDGVWGYYAAHAALVYRLTGDRAYYDRALDYLRAAAAEWELIRAHHRIPLSRCFVKINALAAYDWLYNDMPPAERAALGAALARPMHAFYWYWRGSTRPQRKSYPYRLGK